MDEQSIFTRLCVGLRMSHCYLGMTIFQLSLAVAILCCLYYEYPQLAVFIQIWAVLFISVDLIIRYFSREPDFFKQSNNLMDLSILTILSFCLFVNSANKKVDFSIDSTFGAILIILRYCVQFYRVVSLVYNAQILKQTQKSSNSINLNTNLEAIEVQPTANFFS